MTRRGGLSNTGQKVNRFAVESDVITDTSSLPHQRHDPIIHWIVRTMKAVSKFSAWRNFHRRSIYTCLSHCKIRKYVMWRRRRWCNGASGSWCCLMLSGSVFFRVSVLPLNDVSLNLDDDDGDVSLFARTE